MRILDRQTLALEKKKVVTVAPATLDGNGLTNLVVTMSAEWITTQLAPDAVARASETLTIASVIILAATDERVVSHLPPNIPVIACGANPPSGVKLVGR